jgi:hypothetical protein
MRIFLLIIGILAFVLGLATLGVAKSAVHEIEAYILFVIFAVCLAGAAVVEAIDNVRKSFKKGDLEGEQREQPKGNSAYYEKQPIAEQ